MLNALAKLLQYVRNICTLYTHQPGDAKNDVGHGEPTLRFALQVYEEHVGTLVTVVSEGQPLTERAVLEVLFQRDQIAALLGKLEFADVEHPLALVKLDSDLRSIAGAVEESVSALTLTSWRDAFQPSTTAWWWYLDVTSRAEIAQKTSVLATLSGLAFVMTLTFGADVITRLFAGGPDTLGFIGTIFQVILAFIAGSTFISNGQKWIDDSFARLHVRTSRRPSGKFQLALAVLIITAGFRYFGIPIIARCYNARGLHVKGRDASDAILNYRRAISLDPDNASAHYNLGSVFDSQLDYDKAISEYQRAIELDSHFDEAYSNLARMFIIKSSDYVRALELLAKTIPLDSKSDDIKYSVYKNQAWAYWQQCQDDAAFVKVNLALKAKPSGLEANYILAQLFERRGNKLAALPYWISARKTITGDQLSEQWHAIAVDHKREEQK